MVDRQFLVARAVAETRRRLAPPVLARIPDMRSDGRRPRLGLSHPRIDGNHRSTIWRRSEPEQLTHGIGDFVRVVCAGPLAQAYGRLVQEFLYERA